MHCGIEVLFKKNISLWKKTFSLGGIIRKLDIEELTVSLLKANQIDKF